MNQRELSFLYKAKEHQIKSQEEKKIASGQYEILNQMHQTNHGVFYRVRHTDLFYDGVLYLLGQESSANKAVVARLKWILQQLVQNPNRKLVQIKDCGTTPQGNFYVVTEYYTNNSLEKIITDKAPLALEESLFIVKQILDTLEYIHLTGLIYHDLSPKNIIIDKKFGHKSFIKMKIPLDLNHIYQLLAPDSITAKRLVYGDPTYMSPEQTMGRCDVDYRSDLYSVGLLFYEMLTGKKPFPSESPVQNMAAKMSDLPMPFEKAMPGLKINKDVQHIIYRALALDEGKRFQSAIEFRWYCEHAKILSNNKERGHPNIRNTKVFAHVKKTKYFFYFILLAIFLFLLTTILWQIR